MRADELRAAEIDVTGVPFFLFDGRLGVPGAQSPELLLRVLERAWEQSQPTVVVVGGDGEACSDDECAL